MKNCVLRDYKLHPFTLIKMVDEEAEVCERRKYIAAVNRRKMVVMLEGSKNFN